MNEHGIPSKERFASKIRQISHESGLNLIETFVSYCEDHDLMVEDAISMIDKSLKEEMRLAAIQCNYIRGLKKIKTLF